MGGATLLAKIAKISIARTIADLTRGVQVFSPTEDGDFPKVI